MLPAADPLAPTEASYSTAPRRIDGKRTLLSALLVVIVALFSWSLRWGGPIDLRYDAGVYYILGTSIATGHGYRLLNEPGSPQAIQYPPGLPLIVAIHQRALGTTDVAVVGVWLKYTFALLFAGLSVATFALCCRYLGVLWGTVATIFCLLHVNTYLLSNLLFTELPYSLISVCLALTLSSGFFQRRTVWGEVVGFLLATAGFLLRTAGIALLAAWVGEAIFRRRWRIAALRAMFAALPFVGWQWYVSGVQGGDPYRNPAYAYQRAAYQYYNVSYAENLKLVDPFKPELGLTNMETLLKRLAANLAVLPISVGEAASEARGFWAGAIKTVFYPGQKTVPWVDQTVLLPIIINALLTGVGWILLLRRRLWFPALFIIGSLGLVCSTPWPQQFLRYLAPLVPFLTIAFVFGFVAAVRAVRRLRSRNARAAGWIASTAILSGVFCSHAFASANSAQSIYRVRVPGTENLGATWAQRRWFYYDQAWADWDRAIDWLGKNAPPDAIVATDAPHLCYLMTGRRAVLPPMEVDPALAERLLAGVPVTYVVIDQLEFLDVSRRYAAPALAGNLARWKAVHRVNKTVIYERRDGSEE